MSFDCAHYTAYRAAGPIVVDGKLDEPSWLAAPRSSAFIDIVTGQPAWFDTRVAILWDDEYLYFGFQAEETDVWGTLTERDSRIYDENDLEIFIAGNDAYYEFEMNALNTIYEVLWIWKDAAQKMMPLMASQPDGVRFAEQLKGLTSGDGDAKQSGWVRRGTEHVWHREGANLMMIEGIGGNVHPRGLRYGLLDWDFPGVRTGVHVDGTLNQRDDVDRGWSAEIAFPWAGLELLADERSLPPKDGDVWRIDCSRFQHIGARGERLDPAAGWTWNRHGQYDSHMPETFTFVTFSSREVD